MADQEEAVKIVIEIVDKFSKPLNALRKELEGLGSKGGEGATKTAKGFEGLRQSIHGVASSVTGLLMPSLKTLGLGFAGVAGTLATFVAGLKSLGGSINELTRLSTETKVSIDKMRELEAVGRRVGITSEQMRAGFRGFAEEMDKVRKGVGGPDSLATWLGRAGIGWAYNQLKGIKDVNKQLDYVLELVDKISNPRDKRRVLERLQLPPNLAQIPRAERERAIEEYRKTVGPLDKATKDSAQRFDEAMTNMALAWEKFINQLAKKGGLDDFTKLLNLVSGSASKAADEVHKAAVDFKSIVADLEKIRKMLQDLPNPIEDWKKKGWRGFLPHFTTPNESVEKRFWQPQSLPGGGGDSKEETVKLIKTGTSEGVVDAFKKMALSESADSTAGGGSTFGGASVIRASLPGGGGGGGGGGQRGPGAHRAGPGGGGNQSEPAPPGGGPGSADKRAVAGTVVDELRRAGLPESAIAGILKNIQDESGFNPNLRHPDQPKFGGEAHFAHGLFQEGGHEWNNYAKWLKENHPGASWQDPRLQTKFLTERLRTGYPALWKKLRESRSGPDSAVDFLREYLKPALPHQRSRADRYRRGVPGVDAYTGPGGGAAVPLPRPKPPEADQPEVPRDQFRYAAKQSNQATRVEGDASVRIDLAGFQNSKLSPVPGIGGMFSDVTVHGGNTAPLASENA
jgi:uncharacterized membrane protein YgcG